MPKASTTSKSTKASATNPTTPRKVLYRKYRPTSLSDVIGQSQVTDTLTNALKQGKIGHAYLFIGPRGTGKTSVARIFAHAVNDFTYNLEDSYLDIVEIDAASNTGVDNIRELREKAIIAPSKGKYKVYIIDEIHMLSKSAANALLKTVEEPPEHVIFIMATTEANKVPITISSRSQIHHFHLADPEIMFQHLRKIADLEKIDITDDALRIVVHRGDGSFRDSLSLLDQIITLTDQTITTELLSSALGLPQDESLSQLIQSYQANNTTMTQRTLKELLNSGLSAETIASELMQKIINESLWEVMSLLDKLTSVQSPFADVKLLLALLSNHQQPPASPRVSSVATSSNSAVVKTVQLPNNTVSHSTESTAITTITQSDTASTATIISQTSETTLIENTANTIKTSLSTTSTESHTKASSTASTKPSEPFVWEDFIQAIHQDNGAIFLELQKCEHELTDNTLHIYPTQKFTVKVLKRSNNNQILAKHLNDGYSLVIHELEDRTKPQDETLSQISAIMGDVRDIEGDTPF